MEDDTNNLNPMTDILEKIHDGSKLTKEKWELIKEAGRSFFDDFPFFDDPKYHALPPYHQKYLLAYTLRDMYGFRLADAYRFASGNLVSSEANASSSAARLKNIPSVRYFMDLIDWARVESMGFSTRRIIEAETEISYSDITEYIEENGEFSGNLKDLPLHIRRAIKSLEIVSTTDKEGVITKKYKISLWDKGQSLHRLEKIKGMHLDKAETTNTTTAITGKMSSKDAAKAYSEMMKDNKK
ncbi:MAG: hypothetical protein JRC93_10470 [Deltaproteobacteria bacterium]|nr:hypothetical protein [Deltaproteobacteria bacterium]